MATLQPKSNFACSILVILVCCGIFSLASSSSRMGMYGNDGVNKSQEMDSSTYSYFYYQERQFPRDCGEVYVQCEEDKDGVYFIKPTGSKEPFEVYCNNTIDGGGWTVFQRRVDGSVNFHRNWADYKEGFGFLHRDFWLGNDKISLLTNQKDYEIRIDVVNVDGSPYFAKHDLFRISDEFTKYRLVSLGGYHASSTASYYFLQHRNQSFSTPDRDNAEPYYNVNCADRNRSAWWYNNCYRDVDLNRPSLGSEGHFLSPYWYELNGTDFVMYSEMKIRSV
ncbi:Fibrinogen-like protein A [Holothuria leucospilota]|uniref:Fibrinogen-like protein A n=1 Tax=Holothuria leucospilota TaxID=206669 RepID=A0A9Q1H5Z2_HOLLE|nr:Fibrinogen-like protein A [Holothuria leucospilota]